MNLTFTNIKIVFLSFLCMSAHAGELSQEQFKNPAKNYQPKTWMHAMNGNMSKPGFAGDFQGMEEAGIGGAIFFHVHRRNVPLSSRGPVRFGTEAFLDHLVHAAAQAEQNGIEFGIHNADGWTSSGGPWVSPEMSMKRITWSEQAIEVERDGLEVIPPQPGYAEGFYRDVAVLALPANPYNQSNAFANAQYSASDPNLNADALADDDWDTELAFSQNDSDEYWVQVEVDTATTLRSLQLETPTRHGDASLQISSDGVNFTTVVEKLRKPRTGARMWAFSPQLVTPDSDGFTAKFFRFVFTKPIVLKRFDLWSVPRIDDWLSMNSMERGRLSMAPPLDPKAITKAGDVLVLNRGDLPEHGVEVPRGRWRIMRFGFTSTGAFNVPATVEGEGLEVDKFDAKALRFHFEQYVGTLAERVRAKGITSFKTTEIDSYEVGGQNWTRDLDRSFEAKFNYDFIPWLPLMTGRVIESPAHSGAILQEFRQHLSDLMVENYFGAFTRLANEYGLESYIEPYGWGPFDELAAGGKADRLMGEFWVRDETYNGRVMAAISSGHVYGKKVISAESFTSIGTVNWYGHPYFFKHYGDEMWARGINETMFHRFAHQPNNHVKPGMTMDRIGSHIDRTQTWWHNGGVEWFNYLARGSYLLQQGVPDADLLIHLGDVAPLRVGNRNNTSVPDGFAYDYANTDVLINRLSVEGGWLVLPEGTRYRALHLHRTDYMHLRTLQRVQELVAAGATVIGEKPEHVIGYSEWPQQAEFDAIANSLWGADDEAPSVRQYRKGRVSSFSLDDSIEELRIQPDVKLNGEPARFFAKRRIGENTLYFFYNDQPEFKQMDIELRDGDGQPEIWNVDDGSVERISDFSRHGTQLKIRMALEPYASRFVVMRRDRQIPYYDGQYSRLVRNIYLDDKEIKTLDGDWEVEFDIRWSGPGKTDFDELVDWADHSEDGIKHYSGTAKYTRDFHLTADEVADDRSIYLDLGDVQQVAEVTINGKKLATLWKPPFAVEISDAVKAGNNRLEVDITNTWVNRLIGDEALPDTSGYAMTGDTVRWLNANEKPPKSERVTFTGYNFFDSDESKKLQSSGLLGPVRLLAD